MGFLIRRAAIRLAFGGVAAGFRNLGRTLSVKPRPAPIAARIHAQPRRL
jgi:hypothetical protein